MCRFYEYAKCKNIHYLGSSKEGMNNWSTIIGKSFTSGKVVVKVFIINYNCHLFSEESANFV